MDNFLLSKLVEEVTPDLLHKSLFKVLLVGNDLYLDFRLAKGHWLRAILDPADSALFIFRLSKADANEAHPFIAQLNKELVGRKLLSIRKPPLDRIVILEFDTVTLSGEKSIVNLILSFAGRNANAYLTDADHYLEAVLKPRGKFRIGDQFTYVKQDFDPYLIQQSIEHAIDKAAMIEEHINASGSPFSPLLKQEFFARSSVADSIDALQSLLNDLNAPPTPLIYSGFQLKGIQSEEFQLQFALHIKTNFLLSHFPLSVAKERDLNAFTFPTLSEAAATYYEVIEQARLLQNKFVSLKKLLGDAIKKLEGTQQALAGDSAKFSDPEKFKRFGDLLLANITTAKIENHKTRVIDYYDESQSEIEIEIGEGKTLQQAAADFFALYQKARRAQSIIAKREMDVSKQLHLLTELYSQLKEEITAGELSEIIIQAEQFLGIKKKAASKSLITKRGDSAKPIGRWFRSPSGFEIVVGRNDKDNDTITFRLARSHDVWLHAADYPGSHVVIRNPNRRDIPITVIAEAAELAAFHSQAKEQNKVAVHYTQKKFVTKPPRAKPGLVRLSAFKTISVEPKSVLEKIEGKFR
jgi:predicted ribosome quality control (RQC) complex YloA/Tae2 family protein